MSEIKEKNEELEDKSEKVKKKEKKNKKENKKEKKVKEKKSSKKIKVILTLFILIVVILGISFFIIPMILMGKIPFLKEETYQTGFLVKYDKNLIYNKYDINITFDDSSIKTMHQGESYGYMSDLESGTYIISFTDVNNADNKVAAVLNVNESEDYPVYKIKADWKGLTISVDSTSKNEILKHSESILETEDTESEVETVQTEEVSE